MEIINKIKDEFKKNPITLSLIIVVIIYLISKNTIEKFTATSAPTSSQSSISQDNLRAIDNLSQIASQMIDSSGNLRIKGNLSVDGWKGMIVAWNSTTPPSGWALCDGQNGTPDLRGRFILGAGKPHDANSPGGSNNNNNLKKHGDNAGHDPNDNYQLAMKSGTTTHTITINEMPRHNHTVSTMGHGVQWFSVFNRSGQHGSEKFRQTLTTSDSGNSQPHNNMPPYYVLTYIIKL